MGSMWKQSNSPGRRIFLAVVAAGIVALVLVVMMIPDGSRILEDWGDGDPSGEQANALRVRRSNTRKGGQESARTPMTGEVVEESTADLQPALIGRIVAAEDGRPLAGCEVFLTNNSDDWRRFDLPSAIVSREEMLKMAKAQDPAAAIADEGIRPFHLDRAFLDQQALDALRLEGKLYARPPEVRTDAEGRFRFVPPPSRYNLTGWNMLVYAPHRLIHRRPDLSIPKKGVADLGDIELHQGWRVTGEVLDRSGQGLVDAIVHVRGLPGVADDDFEPISIRTEQGGWFAMSEPIPEGRWLLTVGGPGFVTHSEWIFVKRADVHRKIVMQSRPCISGVVVHRNGMPAVGIEVVAQSSDQCVQGRGESDELGRFVIRPSGSRLPPVQLLTSTEDLEMLCPLPWVEWGVSGLRRTVIAQGPLGLLLLDAETRAPIHGEFELSQPDDRLDDAYGWENTVRNGRFDLVDIMSGRRTLMIESMTNEWQDCRVELDVPQGRRPRFEVLLHRLTPLTVKVLDPDNAPLSRARVEAMHPMDSGKIPPELARLPRLILRGLTGRDGTVVLGQLPRGQIVDLHVSDRILAPMVKRGVRVTGTPQSLTVRLARGGSIKGRLIPAPAARDCWSLMLIDRSTRYLREVYTGANGKFWRDIVPVGSYDLYLHVLGARGKHLAEVTIEQDKVTRLELKVDRKPSSKIVLTFRGLPPSPGSWQVWPCGPGMESIRDIPDHRYTPGQSLEMDLPPGRYRFVLLPVATTGTSIAHYHTGRDLVVLPGNHVPAQLLVYPRRAQLHIEQPNGRPARNITLELQFRFPRTEAWRSHLTLHTDAQGQVDLQQLTPWPMRLLQTGTRLATTPQRWTGRKRMTLRLRRRGP